MKKSIKITLFSLAILLLAAVSLPFIFKGKIIKLITEEAIPGNTDQHHGGYLGIRPRPT